MTSNTLQSTVRISAEDRTGAVFAAVAARMRNIGDTAARAQRNIDSVARGMSAVGLSRQRHEDIAARMSSIAPILASHGRGRAFALPTVDIERIIQTAAVAGAAAALAAPVAKRIVDAASKRANEGLSQDIAGIDPKERMDIAAAAGEITRRHRSISQTESEEMIRGARTITGDTASAIGISDDLARMRIILKRLTPDQDVDKQVDAFVRAADLSDATKSAEKFRDYANRFAKIQGAFPGSVSPFEMVEFAKKSHGASMKYSPEFVTGVVPSLIQASGGSTTGEMLASFQRNIVDERMDKKAAAQLLKYGLLDRKGHVVGRDLAARDPYLWTRNVLMPSLSRHGVKDVAKQSEIAGGLFSDATGAEVVKRFIEQSENIERDRQKSREAKDLRQADDIERRDLGTSTRAVTGQFENLGATLGGDVTPKLVDLSNAASALASKLSDRAAADRQTRAALWTTLAGGSIVGGGLGLGAGLGALSGSGIAAGAGAGFFATTPLLAALPAAYAGVKGWDAYKSVKDVDKLPPQNWLEEKAAAFDRWAGIGARQKSWSEVAAGLRSKGATGPWAWTGQIKAEAELKGAATISNRVDIGLAPGFALVRSDSTVRADGALRSDVGVTMPRE